MQIKVKMKYYLLTKKADSSQQVLLCGKENSHIAGRRGKYYNHLENNPATSPNIW